ncbi:MAG: hypothetical protein A2Y17_07380 [Clostridiales bacterium GWF2_38_85]|nr:MAG: hypothetical protein A2Y17_07380 [Clostridiales bacterium GWF2_38_85]HBL84306.1 hypothetical protein [Clostridiales bacterium]
MKTITITTHRAINYGAVLQTYALQQTQSKIGYDNLILELYGKTKLYVNLDFKSPRRFLISIVLNLLNFKNRKTLKNLYGKFDLFINNHIKCTRLYRTIEDLENNFPIADFIITGSDQVFSIRGKYSKISMLNFKTNAHRFSYAASLAERDWNSDEKKEVTNILNLYKKVSVRENYAKQYLESFCNITCDVHIDPVFLLNKEEWSKIIEIPKHTKRYILCFLVSGNDQLQALIDSVRFKYDLPVVCVQTDTVNRVKADEYIYDSSPGEFLWLIANAELVVTTSFHGTAFSIIFEKEFYTLTKQQAAPQRIHDLLKTLEISDRIITKADNLHCAKIDYNNVRKILMKEQIKSIDYIKSFKLYLNSHGDNNEN